MWACLGQIPASSKAVVVGLCNMIIHPDSAESQYSILIYYKLFEHVRVSYLKAFTLRSHIYVMQKVFHLKRRLSPRQQTFVIMSNLQASVRLFTSNASQK